MNPIIVYLIGAEATATIGWLILLLMIPALFTYLLIYYVFEYENRHSEADD